MTMGTSAGRLRGSLMCGQTSWGWAFGPFFFITTCTYFGYVLCITSKMCHHKIAFLEAGTVEYILGAIKLTSRFAPKYMGTFFFKYVLSPCAQPNWIVQFVYFFPPPPYEASNRFRTPLGNFDREADIYVYLWVEYVQITRSKYFQSCALEYQ